MAGVAGFEPTNDGVRGAAIPLKMVKKWHFKPFFAYYTQKLPNRGIFFILNIERRHLIVAKNERKLKLRPSSCIICHIPYVGMLAIPWQRACIGVSLLIMQGKGGEPFRIASKRYGVQGEALPHKTAMDRKVSNY